jgi:hypothetical protein
MTHRRRYAIAAIVLLAARAPAQARVVSAPSEPSLLNLATGWARASALGDLRELRRSNDYLELRVWHGFSAAETQATIARREDGHWSAWLARVIRCEIRVDKTVADTASSTTMRGFVAEARRNCGQSATDVAPGARLITTDTLLVQPLAVPESDIEAAWNDARRAGALDLPGRAPHSRESDDGTSFLIELRQGSAYRATEIPDLPQAESAVDTQVKQIYAVVRRLVR